MADDEEMVDRTHLWATMFDSTLQRLNMDSPAVIDRLPGRDAVTDWPSLQEVLRLAGAIVDSISPFERLGFRVRAGGAPPSRMDISRRFRDLAILAHPDGAVTWDPHDRHMAEEAMKAFADAKDECNRLIADPTFLAGRTTGRSGPPQWIELGEPFLAHIRERDPRSLIFTQVSNLQDLNVQTYGLPPQDAVVSFYERAFKIPRETNIDSNQECYASFLQIFEEFQENELYIWAPDPGDKSLLAIIEQGLKSVRRDEEQRHFSLHLIVLAENWPHISLDQLPDLFWHPLVDPWGDKFRDLTTDIIVYNEPAMCVVPSRTRPLYHPKKIIEVVLSESAGRAWCSLRNSSWNIRLGSVSTGPIIRVDTPEHEKDMVKDTLEAIGEPNIVGISGPHRSPGTARGWPRMFYSIYMESDATIHDARRLVALVRSSPGFVDIPVGVTQSFADEDALLVDFQNFEAIKKHLDLFDEILLVSRSRALVINGPETSPSLASSIMTQINNQYESRVNGIYHRTRDQRGRKIVYALPVELSHITQMRQAPIDIAKKKTGDKLPPTTIGLFGLPKMAKDSVAGAVMSKVASMMGVVFHHWLEWTDPPPMVSIGLLVLGRTFNGTQPSSFGAPPPSSTL